MSPARASQASRGNPTGDDVPGPPTIDDVANAVVRAMSRYATLASTTTALAAVAPGGASPHRHRERAG
jgi:hypothetical protein